MARAGNSHVNGQGAPKKRYASRSEAKAGARALYGKACKQTYSTYACNWCKGWHIGKDVVKQGIRASDRDAADVQP